MNHLCAAGVAGQRAGEERSDGSRRCHHDAAETDCRSDIVSVVVCVNDQADILN